jgi:FAD/FMN-containing dehydrogenase
MIVGSDNVIDDGGFLDELSSDLSFVPSVRPRCVVRPHNTGEVQEIVRWANKTLTPLVPVSSGPPHFRGDTVPTLGGSVMVDLSEMKRIIRVDPRNQVALVEPGVTFKELQPELAKAGLSAYLPLSPRGSKSVVGSMLEREPITLPSHHWDSLDPMLCGEIVYGTGEKLRIGEAAGPDSIEEQWEYGKAQMIPFGLSQFDESRLISGAQGTMGVVTWASLKCRPLPTVTRGAFMISAETVEPLLDLSYGLIKIRLGDTCLILNDLNLACLLAQNPGDIEDLRDALPRWVLIVSFEGFGPFPEEKVKYQVGDFKKMLSSFSQLTIVDTLAGLSSEEAVDMLQRPSGEPYWKQRYSGGFQDIFFLTTLDKTPQFIGKMSALAQSRRISPEEIGIYIQMVVQGTSCHCEFNLYYDPRNTVETERVKSLVSDGPVDLMNMGAFFSRPYGSWARTAYSRAAESAIVQKKIKTVFDPRNVLNPGKLCF